MLIPADQVRSYALEKLAGVPGDRSPNDVLVEIFFEMSRRLFSRIVPPRLDPEYWRTVQAVLHAKAQTCHGFLNPPDGSDDDLMQLDGRESQVFLEHCSHIADAYSYLYDHLGDLPASRFKEVAERGDLLRNLADLSEQIDQYEQDRDTVGLVFVPRAILRGLSRRADLFVGALAGSDAFERFIPEFRAILLVLKEVNAAFDRADGAAN